MSVILGRPVGNDARALFAACMIGEKTSRLAGENMTSRKRSARQRQIAEFKAQAGGLDDVFAREAHRRDELDERKNLARRNRACESKMRYSSRSEAQDAIAACAARGRGGLRCYRCQYCGGWHLTSHPRD